MSSAEFSELAMVSVSTELPLLFLLRTQPRKSLPLSPQHTHRERVYYSGLAAWDPLQQLASTSGSTPLSPTLCRPSWMLHRQLRPALAPAPRRPRSSPPRNCERLGMRRYGLCRRPSLATAWSKFETTTWTHTGSRTEHIPTSEPGPSGP